MAITRVRAEQIKNLSIKSAQIATDAAIELSKLAVNPIARANHTGTQSADTLTDGSTNGAFTLAERTRLAGMADGATANATNAQLRDRTTHTGAQIISTVTGLQSALDAKQETSEKGQAGGYAGLDGSGKVPSSQLPGSVLGSTSYVSTWDATANTPTLASGTGTKGNYYVVDTSGSTALDGITDWKVGDWAIFNGTIWEKVDNTDAVASVFGRLGAVTAQTGDYTATQVSSSSTGDVAATNVQAAIAELASEKARKDSFVDRETPSGDVDGTNAAFDLASTPVTGSEHVYLNGILQDSGAGNDYTITAAAITFASAPVTGDKLRVSYRK